MYRGYKSLIVISTNSAAVYLAVVQNQNESWQSGVWLRIKASYWSVVTCNDGFTLIKQIFCGGEEAPLKLVSGMSTPSPV